MKIKVYFLILVLFLISGYSYAGQQHDELKSTEQMTIDAVQKVKNSTVKVETKRFVSTGFFISKDTILTCYHTFKEEGIKDVTVTYKDGLLYASVVKTDPISDLALIRVEVYGKNDIIPLRIADRVDIGQTVLTTGFPLDHNLFTTKGMLSQFDESVKINFELPSHKFNVINMDLNDGNSGGALYDLNGDVVGVIHAEDTELKGFGYTTSIEDIKKFTR